MLSLFPQILFLAPMGTALLRVVAGLTMLYIASTFFKERTALSRERLPIIGHTPVWLTAFGVMVQIGIGALLVIGLYTQAAALLAAIVALKCALFARRYSSIVPLSRSAALLLFAICLSLVVSGAGLFAFDLPL